MDDRVQVSPPFVGTGKGLAGVPVNGSVPLSDIGKGLAGVPVNGSVPLSDIGKGLIGELTSVTGVNVSVAADVPVESPGVGTVPFVSSEPSGKVVVPVVVVPIVVAVVVGSRLVLVEVPELRTPSQRWTWRSARRHCPRAPRRTCRSASGARRG